MSPEEEAATAEALVGLVRARAQATPERLVYRFRDAQGDVDLDYAELLRRVEARAATLARVAGPGERLGLATPQGPEFVVSLFAAFAAGLVVVPLPPPSRRLEGLAAICADCAPAAVLCLPAHADSLAVALGPDGPAVITTAGLLARPGRPPHLRQQRAPPQAALLQYTSGSTGAPRGVVVTFANLLANLERQRSLYGVDDASRGMIWLPPHHDMGLGSGVLQPVYSNSRVMLSPAVWTLQRPVRWLQAITDFQATHTGAPASALEACVASVGDEELAGLDLRSLACCFVGAEAVPAATLDCFAARFSACGFDPRAWSPSYGLAEATLLVTGARRARILAGDGGMGRRRVSCGAAVDGHTVLVVDPLSRRAVADGDEGEVWVRGPSVAAGYWNRPEETAATFAGVLACGDGPFLRTGDLGVLGDGELAITGRSKDIVIVAGRKVHAADVEQTVRGLQDPRLRYGIAAFAVEADGAERLVVALELRPCPPAVRRELGLSVRRRIADHHAVTVHDVAFFPPGRLPRTTSGKLRRHACRELYLGGGDRQPADAHDLRTSA